MYSTVGKKNTLLQTAFSAILPTGLLFTILLKLIVIIQNVSLAEKG